MSGTDPHWKLRAGVTLAERFLDDQATRHDALKGQMCDVMTAFIAIATALLALAASAFFALPARPVFAGACIAASVGFLIASARLLAAVVPSPRRRDSSRTGDDWDFYGPGIPPRQSNLMFQRAGSLDEANFLGGRLKQMQSMIDNNEIKLSRLRDGMRGSIGGLVWLFVWVPIIAIAVRALVPNASSAIDL